MPPGENCIIDIVGVFVRSKLSYANKRQKEALKNVFLTLVGPHSFMVFARVLCTLPFKAFECRRTKLPPVQVNCNFLKANKLNTNPPKATFYCKLQCFMHLRTYEKMPPRSANQFGKTRKAEQEPHIPNRAHNMFCEQWVNIANMIREMPQDSCRLAAKHNHASTKSNLILVGPKSVMVFTAKKVK